MVVAEAVAQFEAEWMACPFQLRAGFQKGVPRVRELLDASFRKPVTAPVHDLADIAERNRLPFAVHDDGFLGRVVPAAVLLTDLISNIADIGKLFVEQEGPV